MAVVTLAPRPKLWWSCRLSIAFCIFLASVQTAILRDNLGIALLCMTKPTGNMTCDGVDAVMPTLPMLSPKKNCEFDWDPSIRGRILGAFLYGYILTTMLGGFISNSYGAKVPIMCGGIGSTIFHMLCPTAALVHTEMFFACRFLQGMCSGLMVGPCFDLLSSWVSEQESSLLVGFAFSGFSFGTIMTYPMSGLLCNTHINGIGGWPLIYYAPVLISILIIIYWQMYLYNTRYDHPNITPEESDYLLENVNISYETDHIPWSSIFTSMPIIAYMVCYLTFLWNLLTMMNNIPMFMQSMLGIKPIETGYLFCIPFTITFFSRILHGETYPMLKNFLGLSHTTCRKLYYVFGNVTVILSLLSVVLVKDITKLHLVTAITVNISIGDFAYTGGFFPTLLDLAPNYAGVLSGLTTFFAFLISCPSTLINSLIVEKNTKEEWNMVLLIIIALSTFSTLFYLMFGSALVQKWSLEPPERGSPTASLFARSIASRTVSLKNHRLF